MKKYYYEASIFGQFFINEFILQDEMPNEIIAYSPISSEKNFEKIISPWSIEEFYHSYTDSKRREIHLGFPKKYIFPKYFFAREIKKRTDALVRIQSYTSSFNQETVDTRLLNHIYLSLISIARTNDILTTRKKKNKIHSKDLLHLAYALIFECHSFLTCDQGFKILKKIDSIRRIMNQKKLKKIIIFADDLSKIIYNIDII